MLLVKLLLQVLVLSSKPLNFDHGLFCELILESLTIEVNQRLHLCTAKLATVLGGVVNFSATCRESPEVAVIEHSGLVSDVVFEVDHFVPTVLPRVLIDDSVLSTVDLHAMAR